MTLQGRIHKQCQIAVCNSAKLHAGYTQEQAPQHWAASLSTYSALLPLYLPLLPMAVLLLPQELMPPRKIHRSNSSVPLEQV